MHAPSLFDQITIIGLGLIGGSIAKAVRENHLADKIIGCDSNATTLMQARAQKLIDAAAGDPRTAVKDSPCVILATPPGSLFELSGQIGRLLERHAVLMDTASVKKPAILAIAQHLPSHIDFVPTHPIAGSEQSGLQASRANLFKKKRVIITPSEPLHGDMLKKITVFWTGLGARIEAMPAELHDRLYAYVSHLPQLLAFCAKPVVGKHAIDDNIQQFLRISASNPDLWAEIFCLNKENLLSALDRYVDAVSHIQNELIHAPSGNQPQFDDTLARCVLFPRIAASCLITTVMEAEKNTGFSFARYAGSGFADFTSPATTPPDMHIEHISNHFQLVAGILNEYLRPLQALRPFIADGDVATLRLSLKAL